MVIEGMFIIRRLYLDKLDFHRQPCERKKGSKKGKSANKPILSGSGNRLSIFMIFLIKNEEHMRNNNNLTLTFS